MKKPIILTIILFTVQFLAPIFAQTEQQLRIVAQTGHTIPIRGVAISPNGKLLASHDNISIKIWDIKKELELDSLNDPIGGVNAVSAIAFSPDGKILASGSSIENHVIRLWNIETGQIIKSFSDFDDSIKVIIFSPDGKNLVSCSESGIIRVWDINTSQTIRFLKDQVTSVESLTFSKDGKNLIIWEEFYSNIDKSRHWKIKLWETKTGQIVKSFEGKSQFESRFSAQSKTFTTLDSNRTIRLWDAENGQVIKTLSVDTNYIRSAVYLPKSKSIAIIHPYNNLKIWDIETGRVLKSSPADGDEITVSNDENYLAIPSKNTIKIWSNVEEKFSSILKGQVKKVDEVIFLPNSRKFSTLSAEGGNLIFNLWDVEESNFLSSFIFNNPLKNNILPDANMLQAAQILTWKFGEKTNNNPTISPDRKLFATDKYESQIKIFNSETGQLILTLESSKKELSWHSFTFSADVKLFAAGGGKDIKIWSVETGKLLKSFQTEIEENTQNVAFSPDGKLLATTNSNSNHIKIWNIQTGKQDYLLVGHTKFAESIAFSSDNQFLISGSLDGSIKLWKTSNFELFVSIIALGENEWVVLNPNGRFDTNSSLENFKFLHWVIDSNILKPLSFEVFMRDYYEPNLLPRLLKCNEENNCEQEFKPVRNLTELNRTQPTVRIVDIKATVAADVVQVTVEAEDVVSEFQRDEQNKFLRSGVEDLRLFRDGQLVGYAPEGEGAVGVDKNGKFTKIFNVRLPKNRDATEFNFTAHAFNSDRVKSETAQKTYTLLKPLPTTKGSAYIVTIGVNANENSDYNLRYAANDARRLPEELTKKLPKDKYENIVQIPLISDYDTAGKLTENNATKAKIKAVLDRLAGKNVSPDALKDVPNAGFLKKVLPEDLVLIAFSGHGYADREGIFYLIPYDIGASASGGLGSVLSKSISSDELSLWLRDIDAGEMMMIVDACHSAAAVQGKDFKPGPMGSRGLGQLSYDKGMRILTATQADNVALELGKLEHGLLTYSLVKNGIELGLADFQPKDNKLYSNEWLSFTLRDVPQLYEKAAKGELKDLFIDGKPKSGVYKLDGQKSNLNLQQPSLFDFSRRERQYELY